MLSNSNTPYADLDASEINSETNACLDVLKELTISEKLSLFNVAMIFAYWVVRTQTECNGDYIEKHSVCNDTFNDGSACQSECFNFVDNKAGVVNAQFFTAIALVLFSGFYAGTYCLDDAIKNKMLGGINFLFNLLTFSSYMFLLINSMEYSLQNCDKNSKCSDAIQQAGQNDLIWSLVGVGVSLIAIGLLCYNKIQSSRQSSPHYFFQSNRIKVNNYMDEELLPTHEKRVVEL